MKNSIIKTFEIPSGVDIELNNGIIVLFNGKKAEKKMKMYGLLISKNNSVLEVSAKSPGKRQLKIAGALIAHIKNMISGLKEEFVYKLEICNVHFPMNVKVEGDKVIIKNFLGENMDRSAKILKNALVEIKGNEISVSSFDKEAAGQTAANIEKATLIKYRDRRVFQDGIFITERSGEKI